jgi:hypothetical protein
MVGSFWAPIAIQSDRSQTARTTLRCAVERLPEARRKRVLRCMFS